jgi:hypothetical protein
MKIERRRCSVCQKNLVEELVKGAFYVGCHCSYGAGYTRQSALQGWEESNKEAVMLFDKLSDRGPYWGS